ncbi:hypothetical protein Rvan_1784 [Rhodomicrobium vannielii ATCC 17100]|uniref:Uncharacterized protein n=1 Tax=Rhodomicrobium vannielii (strain ATCC 17100 / DSM 162 / LMG 4299 / NCIMB 10020 / ATH 3.1.1) TaxID=648757 RepID=E3HZJ2_RHOVT|nr:hypothetical protein Rvan_1784 [Rhodomicrobium vannielii ATCC 17100]
MQNAGHLDGVKGRKRKYNISEQPHDLGTLRHGKSSLRLERIGRFGATPYNILSLNVRMGSLLPVTKARWQR